MVRVETQPMWVVINQRSTSYWSTFVARTERQQTFERAKQFQDWWSRPPSGVILNVVQIALRWRYRTVQFAWLPCSMFLQRCLPGKVWSWKIAWQAIIKFWRIILTQMCCGPTWPYCWESSVHEMSIALCTVHTATYKWMTHHWPRSIVGRHDL